MRHTLTLLTRPQSTRSGAMIARFQGRCSCGDTTEIVPASGMVHGWHAAHLDAKTVAA